MKLIMSDYRLSELFFTFSELVMAHCGDGIGVVFCPNPVEMSGKYADWAVEEKFSFFHKKKVGRIPYFTRLEKHEESDYVNFHDSNENFIFTSRESVMEDPFIDCLILLEGDPKPD